MIPSEAASSSTGDPQANPTPQKCERGPGRAVQAGQRLGPVPMGKPAMVNMQKTMEKHSENGGLMVVDWDFMGFTFW